MKVIQHYRKYRQEVDERDSGAITSQETRTTDVYMKNSSVMFGDNVYIRSELILIPNQTLISLPVAASQLIHHKKSQDGARNPPLLQGGLPSSFYSKWVIGAMLLLTMMAIIITVVLLKDDTIGGIVTRRKWGASSPVCEVDTLKIVPTLVVIHHTVTDECTTFQECSAMIRSMEKYHLTLEFCEIGYNFLVGGDGQIYEGSGYKTVGAHTRTYNSRTLGIAFIGDFTITHPTDKQLKTALDFFEDTMNRGYLTKDFKICGGNQLVSTQSPGQKLAEDLRHWSRYTNNPKEWLKSPQWNGDVGRRDTDTERDRHLT